jgi:methyl-accepting chemotaxis protein
MNRLSLRSRLLLLAGVPMVALLLVAGLAGWSIERGTAALRTAYEDRVVPLKQLKTISDMYAVNIVDTAHQARDGIQTFEQARASVDSAQKTIVKEWQDYTSTFLTDAEKRGVERARAAKAKADEAIARLESILAASDRTALAAFAARELYPAIDPVSAEINTLTTIQLDVAKQLYDDNEHRGKVLLGTMAALLAVALGVAVVLATVVTRNLLRTLGGEPEAAVEIARTVASGDLSREIPLRGDDATSLMAALASMTTALRAIVGDVRSGVDQIAGASRQIAAGNQDLSHRTEEQASSLQQTAASMEEMTAAVSQNSGSAREASSLAGDASRSAAHGGQVVGEVVRTMGEIAAQSKRISDIIGVIDGIAFQTNILALNAAVEAARAGEQGRGFAVVASEVRNLAQRSAQAAREIKTLITDSVAQVDSGSRLAADAGVAIDEVVRRVHAVNDLISGISTASEEQANNVSQVNQAIGQLDQVTQQNAALVEESAAAAESLAEQARQLADTVAVFRLP